jgi:hypothetical protein
VAHLEAEEFRRGVRALRKFVITIATISEPRGTEPYFLSLFPVAGQGCIVRGRFYPYVTDLEKDLRDCIGATDKGLERIFSTITEQHSFTIEHDLSDECAKRLGWFE